VSTLIRLIMLIILAILLVWNGRVLAQTANVADGISAKLRADATRNSTVIALLSAGTQVEVHEAKGDYVRVSAAGKNGWVAQRLLSMKVPSKAVVEGKAGPSLMPDVWRHESQKRQTELALIYEEQERNTWRMLATTLGVAMAAFLSGFWLRGVIFRQRYGWLSASGRYRAVRKRTA